MPIGARFGEVDIFVQPSNARPEPVLPPPSRTKWTRRVPHPVLIGHAASLSQVVSATPLQIAEDKPTLLTLRSSDADSSQETIRHYITEFPKHGELHQVLSVTPVLNTTYDTTLNITAENLPAALCTTTFPDCKSGNCDAPHQRCWYADEEFVIGPPVAREEQVLRQRPRAILNATAALVRDDDRFPTKECVLTDRTYGFEANSWAGVTHSYGSPYRLPYGTPQPPPGQGRASAPSRTRTTCRRAVAAARKSARASPPSRRGPPPPPPLVLSGHAAFLNPY